MALSHHERLDGSGYPKGLRGHQISRFSRFSRFENFKVRRVLAGGAYGVGVNDYAEFLE